MGRAVRVALIVPGFSASDHDWCIPALLTLVRRLTPRVDLEIFALRYPLSRAAYEVAGARVHALGGGTTSGAAKIGLLARTLARVVAAHRERPFDVVHALWADEPGAVAVTAARWLRRPAVVSLMGGELVNLEDQAYGAQRSRAGRAFVRHAIGRATCVTAGSQMLARDVPARAARGVRVIPIGVDVARFCPGPTDVVLAGAFRLLHVASLTPVKDHATVLRAMTDVVRAAPAHLHIVGDGPLRGALEQQAMASGLAGHITFHGAIDHGRLPAFYRAADACVVSSRHESQSLVALEACACGLPVVGTAVGLLPELGDAARVMATGDAPALARAIVDLAADASARSRMGREGRSVVERSLTVEHTVEAWLALWSSLVAAAHGRSQAA